ncbi:hypothetical protein [Hymenobacter volaticus]|uniref:Uncharacterized protein n=1 Tax=Hymenobacter volaticus TaxID=2932254 RepID=A0ABY4G3J1_9BACT|nr:hypothetical protein [Hymenobacter volaticus]UOQ65455.1 hypothetical protein MUN86_18170 [Hymenobacter volaticus]
MNSNVDKIPSEESYTHDGYSPDSEAVTSLGVNEITAAGKHQRLNGAILSTATKLLPLVKLLETIQPVVANDSVFHTRRLKINAQIALIYEQLKEERPKRKALSSAFKTMGDLVLEETRDISKDELKQAAKEVVLATIKNAPAIISAAHQAKLLS